MKLITVQELEAMSPAEQDAAFEAAVVRDPEKLPPGYLARIRARLEDRIADEQTSTTS